MTHCASLEGSTSTALGSMAMFYATRCNSTATFLSWEAALGEILIFTKAFSSVHMMKRGTRLDLSLSNIGGRLFYLAVEGELHSFSLRATTVRALVDDVSSWMVARELILDGFRYDRIIDADVPEGREDHFSPTDAESRIAWLSRQREQDLKVHFKPQPWEQLIKVLRDMGHQEIAKQVAIAKQEQIRKHKFIFHAKYGALCRYGYRPGILIAWALGVAVVWAAIFKVGADMGVMAPTDRHIIEDTKDATCRPEGGGNWTTCASLHSHGYPAFDPIVYSFDLILPVISTQQTKDWAPLTTRGCKSVNRFGVCQSHADEGDNSNVSGYWPLGVAIWLLARSENLAGWIFGLMFVAIVSGLIKKD